MELVRIYGRDLDDAKERLVLSIREDPSGKELAFAEHSKAVQVIKGDYEKSDPENACRKRISDHADMARGLLVPMFLVFSALGAGASELIWKIVRTNYFDD